MRRVITVVVLAGVCVAAFLFAGAAEDKDVKTVKIVFDNAFGLVEGGDFRVGGVKAGSTTKLDVIEQKGERYKAVVTAEITEPGFDDFRDDATCDIKPQSLIGEYYVECQTGDGEKRLGNGGTIPVEQTTSTIPQDLVNNILRRPYRERLRIIISELGAGLAGRPEDLAAVLRRAHPGLRETSRVLKILGDQNSIIERFLADADTVVAELEANKRDVVRWVRETGETAEISATRREELRQSVQKFPGFLDELGPTMRALGNLADEQVPLLTDLQTAAPDLNEFIKRLGPFSRESLPALDSLGAAAKVGTRAFKRGTQEVNELKDLASKGPQTGPAPDQQGFARPFRQLLESVDDRNRAIDDDERAKVGGPPATDPSYAGGRGGFTGFEALVLYPYWQGLSINGFDNIGHILRISIQADSDCSPYHNELLDPNDPDSVALFEKCNAWLGPYQPGHNAPDPSLDNAQAASLRSQSNQPAREFAERRGEGQPEAGPLPGQDDASRPQVTLPPQVRDLLEGLQPGRDGRVPLVNDILDGLGGGLRDAPNALDGAPQGPGGGSPTPNQLLDFLLAP